MTGGKGIWRGEFDGRHSGSGVDGINIPERPQSLESGRPEF